MDDVCPKVNFFPFDHGVVFVFANEAFVEQVHYIGSYRSHPLKKFNLFKLFDR